MTALAILPVPALAALRGRRIPLALIARGLAILGLLALALTLTAAIAPRALGYETLLLKGGSMGKAVPVGSLAVSRPLFPAEVEVGTTILMTPGGSAGHPVLHRVIERTARDGEVVVRTKGDANDEADPAEYVLPDEVLSPAFVFPYVGYLVTAVTTPMGWAGFVVVPATIVLAVFLVQTWAPAVKPVNVPAATHYPPVERDDRTLAWKVRRTAFTVGVTAAWSSFALSGYGFPA